MLKIQIGLNKSDILVAHVNANSSQYIKESKFWLAWINWKEWMMPFLSLNNFGLLLMYNPKKCIGLYKSDILVTHVNAYSSQYIKESKFWLAWINLKEWMMPFLSLNNFGLVLVDNMKKALDFTNRTS
jgi:hypothetical protein